MVDYKKMHFQLAAKTADALEILITVQQEAENIYIEEEIIVPLTTTDSKYSE